MNTKPPNGVGSGSGRSSSVALVSAVVACFGALTGQWIVGGEFVALIVLVVFLDDQTNPGRGRRGQAETSERRGETSPFDSLADRSSASPTKVTAS